MTDPYDTATSYRANGQGRVPPHNLEAERALLGAMLLKVDAVVAALEILKPAHFHDPGHGHVFEAIEELHHAGETADPVTVSDVLASRGHLKAIGGNSALLKLQADTPATSNAARYAEIVKGHADLRQAIAVADKIAEAAYSLNFDAATVATKALELVMGLVDSTNNKLKIFDMEQLMVEHLDELEARQEAHQGGSEPPGLQTGFRDLDERTGGLRPGELVTVIAEPGVGKSGFVGNIARQVAAAGHGVTIFSVEMARLELMDRQLAAEAGIPLSVLRSGGMTDADWDRIHPAYARLHGPVWIVDDPDVTLEAIDAAIRRTRPGLFVVDYAQILKAPQGAGTREREVAAISSGLKRMARRHEIPGIVLSAINRNAGGRIDRRPVRSDIRESGQLEYDSNEIWGLYRDELVNDETSDPGIMEVIGLKSRNSQAGTTRLRYDPDTQLITDLPSFGATA